MVTWHEVKLFLMNRVWRFHVCCIVLHVFCTCVCTATVLPLFFFSCHSSSSSFSFSSFEILCSLEFQDISYVFFLVPKFITLVPPLPSPPLPVAFLLNKEKRVPFFFLSFFQFTCSYFTLLFPWPSFPPRLLSCHCSSSLRMTLHHKCLLEFVFPIWLCADVAVLSKSNVVAVRGATLDIVLRSLSINFKWLLNS